MQDSYTNETVVLIAHKDLHRMIGFEFDLKSDLENKEETDILRSFKVFLMMAKMKRPADSKYKFGMKKTIADVVRET